MLDWAGFKGAVSYTFDDANQSQLDNYSAMNSAGGKYTFYLITSKSEAGQYSQELKDGHEIGNHTQNHTDCASAADIDNAQQYLRSTYNITAYAFAAPDGASACQSYSNKFLTNRSVGGGDLGVGDTSKFSWLPAQVAPQSGTIGYVAGRWKVWCIHGFNGGSDRAYQPVDIGTFTSSVRQSVSAGYWVDTVSTVAAYMVGQQAISQGSGTNITWTLPSIFPPNKCVRVTVTGGTLTQNGKTLPWDEHGYYEVSLDAKSLTIQ